MKEKTRRDGDKQPLSTGENPETGPTHCGRITIDSTAMRVWVEDEEIRLRPREFATLDVLLRHTDQTLTREQIAQHVFGDQQPSGFNAVELYIARLRRKLAGTGVHVRTLRGLGYMLQIENIT